MKSSIQQSVYGKLSNGSNVIQYTLKNKNNIEVKIISYGGIITDLIVPDRKGKFENVVLGFDDLKGYLKNDAYFGCIVGRYANRIANGKFNLNNKTYQLTKNNGENILHGGLIGFDKVNWVSEGLMLNDNPTVNLSYLSKDGEEGFPGNLQTKVIYTLTNSNELIISYEAVTDSPTPINLTNHTYFNLSGNTSSTILDHELFLDASRYAPSNENLIPTGEYDSVLGKPIDFLKPTKIGDRIQNIKSNPVGYDHSFVLNQPNLKNASAIVKEYQSGRKMSVFCSQPSIQLYTSNFLNSSIIGKGGSPCFQYQGLCLETQHLPDSMNQSKFPTVILLPGQKYSHQAIHAFSVF